MLMNAFFLYFVIPAFTLFLIFTNRYYYTKKQSKKMRFNLREDLFFGNIVGPIVGLIITLAIYANVLNIRFFWELKWEMLVIFSIAMLTLILGIGLGAHIAAVSIEKSLEKTPVEDETENILYFFHWPFGHKLTFVPTALIFYSIVLFDLFKGTPETLRDHQVFILAVCAVTLAAFTTVCFIVTHVTRIMYYTLGILSLSIGLVLLFENITLKDHLIAFFFTILYISIFVMVSLYRYIHHLSGPLHDYIQSKFPDGDKVKEG